MGQAPAGDGVMAGYVWKGTPEPPKPAPKRKPRQQPPVGKYCGTRTGFAIHKQGGEKPCQPCRDAENAYSREYQRKVYNGILTPAAPFNPDACGTMPGYRRHRRRRVPVCEPCKAARKVYDAPYTKKAA